MRKLMANRITSTLEVEAYVLQYDAISQDLETYLTYNEMGTTVLSTMAYEKKTSNEITVAPVTGSSGINEAHGR